MSDLDLNIDNYSTRDLESFFKLNSNVKYTAADIELQETIINSQLLSSGHVDKRIKNDLMTFLNTAKNRLINAKCVPLYRPTTLPKNPRLDSLNLPLSKEAPSSRMGEILERPDTQFIYTQNSDYFPGKANPLNIRTITKCLNIDSVFRNNTSLLSTSSDFTFQLPIKLNKVVSMQLTAFEIPKTFYGISNALGNNYLNLSLEYITVNQDDTDSVYNDFIINIPDGNYENQSLIDEINNQLCPRDGGTGYISPANFYNQFFAFIQFRLDDSLNKTGKVIMEISVEGYEYMKIIDINGSPVSYEILNFSMCNTKDIYGKENPTTELYSKLGWNLGFKQTHYQGHINYWSETTIDTNLNHYIYLSVEDFNNSVNNTFISAFNESIISPDILARITINPELVKYLNLDNSWTVNEPRQYFGPVDIQRLRIRLFNNFGNLLELNNMDYSLCLSFKMLYDL